MSRFRFRTAGRGNPLAPPPHDPTPVEPATPATPINATTYTDDEGVTWRAWTASTGGSAKAIDWYIDASGQPCIVSDAATYIDTSLPSSSDKDGMMKDPWLTNGQQGFDIMWSQAGISALNASVMTYTAGLNIDPGKTGTRIQANAVGSYVKSLRRAAATTSMWSVFERFGVLTILADIPNSGFFAPAVSATDKTPPFVLTDLNYGALGLGFTLSSGMPSMTTASSNGYLKSPIQPFWGTINGEQRRRAMITNQALTTNGYSGGDAGYGVYWSEWFHALLGQGEPGATDNPANFCKAIRLGLELVANAQRGVYLTGGAGQSTGRKQFAQLVGHTYHDLMPDALAMNGSVTQQPFWVTEDFVGTARGGFNGNPSNHSVLRGTHYAEHVGRPDWFVEPVEGVYPHSPSDLKFDSNPDSDYNLTAGIPSFIEYLNIILLKEGPNGWDGSQVLARSDDTFGPDNPYASVLAYWDMYRTYPMGANWNTAPYSIRTYHLRYAAAFDARRADAVAPKWGGVPYAFSPTRNSASFLAAATGGWTWNLEANANNTVWPTITVTQVDMRYSLDGRSWTTDTSVGMSGSKTTGIPVGVKVYTRFVAHNSVGQGIEPVNYPYKTGEVERMIVTPSGTPSGTPVNVTTPKIVQIKYPNWAGPEYEQPSGAAVVGKVYYAAKGWWTGNVTGTWSYQWTRNGANISGATSDSYTAVSGDNSATIGLKVTIGGVTATASNTLA